MRLMAVGQCHPGDVVADTVRDRTGAIIAERGQVLDPETIHRLQENRIPVIAVEWPGLEAVEPHWWFPDHLFRPLVQWVEQGSQALEGDGFLQARHLVREISEAFPVASRRAFEWIPLYRGGNPAFVAWINTIGLVMKLTQWVDGKWVEDYGLAALLTGLEYDMKQGTVTLPQKDRLAPLVDRIRPLSSVPPTTRVTITQHHARWDGSGDPPLKGEQIYHGARILGMAELMAALLFRTDEPALPVQEALEWMVGGAGMDFPLELVQLLQRTVAPYPIGAVVRLGSGEVGIVWDIPHDWPTRPVIRMLNGRDRGQMVPLKDPDQHVRVITGYFLGRDWPEPEKNGEPEGGL
ncbi:MAG: phosphohydrolase [Sulfobacillus sp.]|nr:phosphohydrolase [Sulfobacillus sp.]